MTNEQSDADFLRELAHYTSTLSPETEARVRRIADLLDTFAIEPTDDSYKAVSAEDRVLSQQELKNAWALLYGNAHAQADVMGHVRALRKQCEQWEQLHDMHCDKSNCRGLADSDLPGNPPVVCSAGLEGCNLEGVHDHPGMAPTKDKYTELRDKAMTGDAEAVKEFGLYVLAQAFSENRRAEPT